MNSELRFNFKPVDKNHQNLVHTWLKKPHVGKWFYGQGLQNTINHLDEFLQGLSSNQYWLAFDNDHPFAFLITSSVCKPTDELTKWCQEEGLAITLDMLIGDTNYLRRGLSHLLIKEFILSKFNHVSEVLIDPEATNTHAVHVYKKVGFKTVGEFVPSHSPHLHYMMRLSMKDLKEKFYHLEHYNTIPPLYEGILFKGISDHAFQKKGLSPIQPFSVFIKDIHQNVIGGISGVTYYESLYIDSLWIDETSRQHGWGTKLMHEAENIGRKRGVKFATVNTMDWEGLQFYQKLGYSVEFTREGYAKDSKMYMLRKNFNS